MVTLTVALKLILPMHNGTKHLGSVRKIDAKMLLRLFESKMILNFKGVVLLLREIW